MAISAADVKNLREMTGVGMMDCKKALTECDGDIDKAIEYLREKGLAASAKKAGRIAAEGMAYATVENGVGVVVEVNAEKPAVCDVDVHFLLQAPLGVYAIQVTEQEHLDNDHRVNGGPTSV